MAILLCCTFVDSQTVNCIEQMCFSIRLRWRLTSLSVLDGQLLKTGHEWFISLLFTNLKVWIDYSPRLD